MITVTKGQWFPLTIGNISYGGAAFDLQGATEVSASLVSTLGVKSPLSFEVTAYNELSAVNDGSLSAGKYAIEVSCKGSDGKSYRMKSPGAVIEVSSSTTSSTGSTSVRVAGDEWELTADVEMHEGQARTYMSLLEEARQRAMKATDDAEAVIDNVQSSVTQAQEASDAAKSASEAASKAVADTNKALENVTEMEATVNEAENKRAQSEQSRESAETERANAEKARVAAETARAAAEDARKDAEAQRETAFTTAKAACETAASNATIAADKANTATANTNIAASNANTAASNANTAAANAKADYIGDDNYVYKWNSTKQTYEKSSVYAKGGQGIQGIKGDAGKDGSSFNVVFKYNGFTVDVLDYDTVKAATTNPTFEADFYQAGAAYNAAKAVMTSYDSDGSVLGSAITVTQADKITSDGGNLYLSKGCVAVEVKLYTNASDTTPVFTRSCTVIKYATTINTLIDKVAAFESAADTATDKANTAAEKATDAATSATTAANSANAAAEKANAAAEEANASLESKVDYSKMLSDIWVGTEADYNAITTKQEGTIYLIDDTTTAGSTTAGTGTVEKMWFGTKNDYDRLSTKDDNVLYLLVEEF